MSKLNNNKTLLISELLIFIGILVFVIINNTAVIPAIGFLIIGILIPLFIIFPYYALLLLIIVRNTTDIYANNTFVNIFNIVYLNFSALLGILIIIWVIFIFLKEKVNFKKITLSRSWILFLSFSLISIIYSVSKLDSVKMFLKLANLYLIYSISYFYFVKYKKKRIYFLNTILISYLLPFILGFYQIISKTRFTGPEGFNRIYGSFTHPNIFSFNLFFLLLILIIFYLKQNNNYFKKIYFLVSALVIVLIIYTLTRSTWIATTILLITLLFIYRWQKIPFYIFILSSIVFIAFILINYTPLQYYNWNNISIVRRIISPNRYMSSWDWRVSTWSQMISYIPKSPIIGYGLDTYRFLREKQVYSPHETSYYAHNDYLKILIELGIIGFLLYLNLIFQVLKQIFFKFKESKEKKFLISGVALFLIFLISGVDNILMATSLQWVMWVFIAYLLSED